MTHRTARLARLTGGLIAGAVVLTGCSDGADADETDVAFAQDMIVHHQEALEMSQLAAGRAEDQRVLDLADRIEAAQDPEIDTMTGWLEAWEEPTSAEDSDEGMGHGSDGADHGSDGADHGSGGMQMPEEDMSALADASGADFDRMWLEMMIEHHEGAVQMSEAQLADGQHADAVELAENIIESQSAEIEEMTTLLSELGS